MAKKNEKGSDFSQETKLLKSAGPERLYLIYGQEDYLSEHFLLALKSACLPDGDDGFSYKKFDGPGLELTAFAQALDAMPFLSERILIELRNIDLNKLTDPEKYVALLSTIPAYCTVVFIQSANYELDGRLKLNKFLKEKGKALAFLTQDAPALTKWIIRRFAAHNKTIDTELVRYLITYSGDLMNRLIPEIEKVASYAKGERITKGDIDAVANRLPEADVFDMINQICDQNYEAALKTLAELMKNKDNSAFSILALLSYQLRRLLGIRLAVNSHLGKKEMMELFAIRYDYLLDRLVASARKIPLPQIVDSIEECVNAEHRLKSSSCDELEVLKDTLIRMMLGARDAKA